MLYPFGSRRPSLVHAAWGSDERSCGTLELWTPGPLDSWIGPLDDIKPNQLISFKISYGLRNPFKILFANGSRRGAGVPREGPERSKTAQDHPRASQKTPRGGHKASLRASGSALEALWTRLERHWGVQEVTLRDDFEPKIEIGSGNTDFLKSMLSPRREHRF